MYDLYIIIFKCIIMLNRIVTSVKTTCLTEHASEFESFCNFLSNNKMAQWQNNNFVFILFVCFLDFTALVH